MKAHKILGKIAICCLFIGCCSVVCGQTTLNQKELNEGLETLMKENSTIKTVNPLFNNYIIMHYPVTTSYPNTILINRAWYMVGRKREISCFMIKDDEFIKIDWNKKH